MKEFEKWFKKAENDLLVITNNLASQQVPIDACFHAQQAAEKYLKAYLVSKKISFPKIHDLVALNNLYIEINSLFIEIHPHALRLSDYAITPRYPDAFDDLTIQDANNALQDAITIKNLILKHFLL